MTVPADAAAGNPYQTAGTTCLPSGAIRLLTGGGPPLEIFHTPSKVAILKENGGWSRIYLNLGHLPADELYPMFYGDSIGHWEGDTLVVDTTDFNDKTWLDRAGHPHSEKLHVMERMRRMDQKSLQIDLIIEDPKAYTKPITSQLNYQLRPDWHILEHACTDYPRPEP